MKKVEVLNTFFTSVSTSKTSLQESQALETKWKSKEDAPLSIYHEHDVREYLSKMVIHKTMVPDGMHPQVLRELPAAISSLLLRNFERLWQLGEVSKDWRKANVTSNFKEGRKEDPGNYRLVTLTSIPRKAMQQVILETIFRHMKDKKVIRSSQHGEVMLNQPENL
ncbi:rna-directed dna polymerase from mobile element jockey-like [Limosa lapponica baueri]|uniref:Rna-directed dna polymerase from mobile element jockey-like n=1 Tax=Limosa lapponica baueri TaxID=1758121 RepID=A0A2I0UUB7_LIMLA|nr:rna-directed dna polymerase from mobile element jockey-like [Limosa lapponica baueri]